jgi:hypothetical protein
LESVKAADCQGEEANVLRCLCRSVAASGGQEGKEALLSVTTQTLSTVQRRECFWLKQKSLHKFSTAIFGNTKTVENRHSVVSRKAGTEEIPG